MKNLSTLLKRINTKKHTPEFIIAKHPKTKEENNQTNKTSESIEGEMVSGVLSTCENISNVRFLNNDIVSRRKQQTVSQVLKKKTKQTIFVPVRISFMNRE